MRQLLDEQNRLGWYFFFVGFWPRAWAEVQITYLRQLKKILHINGWKGKAQLGVWEYTYLRWQYHNKQLHGETPEE